MKIKSTKQKKQSLTISNKAFISLFEKIGIMLRANITLLDCLQIIDRQTTDSKMKMVVAEMKNGVQKGKPLYTVLNHYNKSFNSLLIQMLKVGENIGDLGILIDAYVTFQKKMIALQRKFYLALVYPGMVLFTTFIVVSFILLFITPTFQDIFQEFSDSLPANTRILVYLSENYVKFLLSFIFLFVGIFVWLKNAKKHKKLFMNWDKISLHVPFFSNFIEKKRIVFFCRTLGLLIKHGNSLNDSLPIAIQTVENHYIKLKLAKVEANLKKGKNFSSLLQHYNIFPDMVTQMITSAESSAMMDKILLQIADEYEQLLDNNLKLITGIIEPVLILLLGIIVAFILISLYSPMFDMIGNVNL